MKSAIIKEGRMLTYMGRGNQYSECGFLGFNMKHPDTVDYAMEMKRMYDSDEIYNLIEHHDSYIWESCKEKV